MPDILSNTQKSEFVDQIRYRDPKRAKQVFAVVELKHATIKQLERAVRRPEAVDWSDRPAPTPLGRATASQSKKEEQTGIHCGHRSMCSKNQEQIEHKRSINVPAIWHLAFSKC